MSTIDIYKSTILFYISTHGSHIARFKCLLPYLKEHLVVVVYPDPLEDLCNEYANLEVIPNVPLKHDSTQDLYKPECFHPTPLNGSSSAHFLPLVTAINEYQPDIAVIDVSVEAALLCRLMGLPFITIRQNGQRDDLPHKLMYESAVGMIAAYPLALEDTTYLYKTKTHYTGGFSKFHYYTGAIEAKRYPKKVLVMPGKGGTNFTHELLVSWAKATPNYEWTILTEGATVNNLNYIGRKDDLYTLIYSADVVVANAGNNTVMEVGSFRKPYLCIPDERPFDEQVCKAMNLSLLGPAVVSRYMPKYYEIEDLLCKAARKDMGLWQNIINPKGALDFVKAIERYIHQSQALLNPSVQTPV